MNACLSPEPSHASPPINPRLMCWPETKIELLLHMLSYAYKCLVELLVVSVIEFHNCWCGWNISDMVDNGDA